MRHELKKIQSKYHNIGTCRTNEISLLCYVNKNMYLKMDILDYDSFVNLLVSFIEITSLNLYGLL